VLGILSEDDDFFLVDEQILPGWKHKISKSERSYRLAISGGAGEDSGGTQTGR